jgi:hypothetical protein
MKTRHYVMTPVILFLGYLISFGPILYFGIRATQSLELDSSASQIITAAVRVGYYPHFYLMTVSESYFNYGKWIALQADENIVLDFDQYKTDFNTL